MENIVFFGHHKCASTWMSNIFYELQSVTGWTINYGIDASKKINVIGEAKCADAKTYRNFRGIHLIRDPRDIIISGYYSHLKTHPTEKRPDILEFRKKLKKTDFNEGLMLEMEFSRARLLEMGNWDYTNPNILELRFEDFTAKPDWNAFFDFLNLTQGSSTYFYGLKKLSNKLNNRGLWPIRFNELKIPAAVLNEIPKKFSFERLSEGRQKGQQDESSHYRKGRSGEWKTLFTSEHKRHFKEKFPHLLEQLGYEQNDQW